jgi:hypothetical protein
MKITRQKSNLRKITLKIKNPRKNLKSKRIIAVTVIMTRVLKKDRKRGGLPC